MAATRPRFRVVVPFASVAVVAVATLIVTFRLEQRVDELDASVAAVRGDVRAARHRSRRSIARLERELAAVGHPLHAALSWPVNGAVNSPYGRRFDCCYGERHPGIDIDAPAGEPVHAAAPGTVVAAGWQDGYGNRVVVDHGRGLTTVYAHLESIAIGEGVFVTPGSVLGSVGCTGACEGVHLHFEVRINGRTSDPEGWLPKQPAAAAALHWAG